MILRLLTDVFTVTCLLSAAAGYALSQVGRRAGAERGRVRLWIALFFTALALFVLFDNALPDYYFPSAHALSFFIPAVVALCYLLLVSGALALADLMALGRPGRLCLLVAYAAAFPLVPVSLLSLRYGAFWYIRHLGVPMEILFMALTLAQILFFGAHIIGRRLYRDRIVLTVALALAAISLYVCGNRVLQELDKGLYATNHFLPLTLTVPVFVAVLYRLNREKSSPGTGGGLPEPLLALLSEKERLIAAGLAEGKLYKEIAYDLAMSEGNVKKHVNRIYAKLGVSNRFGLLRLTERDG